MGLREMAEHATDEALRSPGADTIGAAVEARVRAEAAEPMRVEMDPDIPESRDVPVHAAWSRVMGEVLYIAKADATTTGNRYNYRGVDRVVDSVAPMLRKHGIIVMPVNVRAEYTVIETKNGAAMNYCRATVSFAIIGPRGDALSAPHPETGIMGVLLGEAIGEGFDSGDKSSMKAQSVAYREFLIKALAIPVSRPQADPEHGDQHEIAGPKRRTPAQYAADILSEETSINKLSQIQQELYGDKATAMIEVELADGEKVRLVDLVRRVGKQRTAAQA
jgi:hypothetical protein